MTSKVLVIGASSGVGLQVTRTLLEKGNKYDVFALVRSQERTSKALGSDSSRVKFVNGDITKKESLVAACNGMDAVICSVGAQAGWRLPGWNQYTPKYVDYMGVQYLVEAAVNARVPKFVCVTSMNVTRPWSFVGLLLNTLFGRILYWKRLAEQKVREAYKEHDNLAYYIIRPGGLNDNEGGQHGIIFEQGDTGTGRITRQDVAKVCVACINEECPPNVTFEIVNDNKDSPGDLKAMSSLMPDNL